MTKEAAHWSYPNPAEGHKPKTKGMVWMGKEEATDADLDELFEMMDGKVAVDKMSLVGRHAPNYNSYFYHVTEQQNPNGGKGSKTYEHQKVGSGVDFTDEPIWHINAAGTMVKDVPPNCGAHHYNSEEGVNYAGPEPGSEAEKLLGDGQYKWGEGRGLYLIK